MPDWISDKRLAKFWAQVRKSDGDGCWEWQGGKSTAMRYGAMSLGGRGNTEYTHRIGYRLAKGPIPHGLCVLHTCDNPPCCNPAHLSLGTRSANMADKVAKGRQHRGERTGTAVLTDDKAAEILTAYATKEFTCTGLASEYRVTEATIRSLVNGETWTHVPGPRLPREEIVALGKLNRADARRRAKEARRIAAMKFAA